MRISSTIKKNFIWIEIIVISSRKAISFTLKILAPLRRSENLALHRQYLILAYTILVSEEIDEKSTDNSAKDVAEIGNFTYV